MHGGNDCYACCIEQVAGLVAKGLSSREVKKGCKSVPVYACMIATLSKPPLLMPLVIQLVVSYKKGLATLAIFLVQCTKHLQRTELTMTWFQAIYMDGHAK